MQSTEKTYSGPCLASYCIYIYYMVEGRKPLPVAEISRDGSYFFKLPGF
jgi:hypothetical protein